MSEALAGLAGMSPIAAVVVILGVASTVIVQVAKKASWSKGRAQGVALVVSVVLGLAAYIVSGIAVGIPGGVVDVVSSGLVIIAGVLVASRAAYAVLGHAIPDGTSTSSGDAPESGLTADEWQQVQNVTGDHTHRAGDDA